MTTDETPEHAQQLADTLQALKVAFFEAVKVTLADRKLEASERAFLVSWAANIVASTEVCQSGGSLKQLLASARRAWMDTEKIFRLYDMWKNKQYTNRPPGDA